MSDTFAGEAKAICATCPVAEACLEYAIATRQGDGVWGGLTAVERHRLIRRRQKMAREEGRRRRTQRRAGLSQSYAGVGFGSVVGVARAAQRVG